MGECCASRRQQFYLFCPVFFLAGICGCTWISFRLGQSLGSAGFLYLVFVVLAALSGGFWQATLVSVVAVGCLDYFFDEPLFSFTVGSLSNWVEVGAFEFTALMISQLSNRAHLRALEAMAERRDTARLYQTARQVLLLEATADPGSSVTALIREAFDLRRVVLCDGVSAKMHESGESGSAESGSDNIVQKTREAHLRDTDAFDATEKTWFCVLQLGTKPVGALALCGKKASGTEMRQLTATALASLAAIALGARTRYRKPISRRGRAPSRAVANRRTGRAGTSVQDAAYGDPYRQFRASRGR